MANDLNDCKFIGRLAADPDHRVTPSGMDVTNIRLAVGKRWRDKDTGEQREETQWIPVTLFKGAARVVDQFCRKGSQIFVTGEWHTREYEKDGQKQYFTSIRARDFQLLGGNPNAGTGQQSGQNSAPPQQPPMGGPDEFSDDIPF